MNTHARKTILTLVDHRISATGLMLFFSFPLSEEDFEVEAEYQIANLM